VLFRATRYNVGIVEVDGDRLTFIGVGEDGEQFYRETLTAADLTPVDPQDQAAASLRHAANTAASRAATSSGAS
jgi:hypothetical protein